MIQIRTKGNTVLLLEPPVSPSKLPNKFTVVCYIIIWIGCSSVTQIANKKVVTDVITDSNSIPSGTSPLYLVCLQMVFGTFVYIIQCSMYKKPSKSANNFIITSSRAMIWIQVVGFCNVLTHVLTLYAIQLITPALTHIIRGTEPIWMIIFSYLLLGRRVSLAASISVVLMTVGVISIAKGGTHEKYEEHKNFIRGILITIAANFAITVRNCGSKIYSLLTLKELHYPEVCAYSLIWVIIPTLIQHFVADKTCQVSIYIFIATIFHVAYSSMSFYVLSFMEPTSHSIIKLVSRTVAVLSLTVFYGVEVYASKTMMFGVSLCIIGGIFYSPSATYWIYQALQCLENRCCPHTTTIKCTTKGVSIIIVLISCLTIAWVYVRSSKIDSKL